MDEVKEEIEAPVVPDAAPDTTANQDERALIEEFSLLKEEIDTLNNLLKAKNEKLEIVNDKLLAMLEADEKKSSAKYQGLGHVTIVEGKVYASISKGMQDQVLDYLRSIGREDMIRTVVHSATLTSFVNECLKQNEPVPPGVTHYRPKWINFYPAK